MRYGLLAAILFPLLLAPAAAQDVEIKLTDGGTVRGELQGFENGSYQVVVNGSARSIPERDVLTVNLLSRIKPSRRVSNVEDIQDAIEAGRYEEALDAIETLMVTLEAKRDELHALFMRAEKDALSVRVGKQDTKGILDDLKRILPKLASSDQKALLTFFADKLSDLLKSDPQSEFTASFAEALAKSAADANEWTASERRSFAEMFQSVGEKAEALKSLRVAAVCYRLAVQTDSDRAGPLKAKRMEILLAVANDRNAARDYSAAVTAADELLTLAADPKAAEIREEALYGQLRRELEPVFASEYEMLLKKYLEAAKKPEYRKWAEEELARVKPSEAEVAISSEIRRYYPVKPGAWYKYSQPARDTFKRIHTDSVLPDDGVVKVYYTLEDIYKTFSSSKIFQVQIDATSVALSSGEDREMLLKFPLRTGDHWEWQTRKEAFSRKVISLNETVATLSGTYRQCLVIEFTSRTVQATNSTTVTSRSYYAPNVGLVKLEFMEPEYHDHNLELVEKGLD